MIRVIVQCYECEHEGDLRGFAVDIGEAGGVVTDSRMDENHEEEGIVEADVDDVDAFTKRLSQTGSRGLFDVYEAD